METTMSAYEQHLAERAVIAAKRLALVQGVAAELLAQLGNGWTVTRPIDTYDNRPGQKLVVSDGRAVIELYPGGYKRADRIIAVVPTVKQVLFAPNDWDTVSVSGFADEKTYDETRNPIIVARAIRNTLVPVAHKVAEALDAEQARMSAARDHGRAVLNQFLRAGWRHSETNGNQARAYVPEGHALRALGIDTIHIDLETGGMEYGYRPYLPGDTTPKALIGLVAGPVDRRVAE